MAVTRKAKDEQILVRGSAHAQNVFGLSESQLLNAPKFQFENFIRFRFNANANVKAEVEKYFSQGTDQIQTVGAFVKTATYPNMSIDTETLNQYNRKRILQKKIEFEPITVTMHDVSNGMTLKFWELYYNYYFKDGNDNKKKVMVNATGGGPALNSASDYTKASDFISDDKGVPIIATDVETHNEFGFNIHAADEHLLNFIEIFHSRGGKYSKVVLVNPKITTFKHDTLDYAGSANTMELTFTIDYEYAVYGNDNYELTTGGDLRHMPEPTMPIGDESNLAGLKSKKLPRGSEMVGEGVATTSSDNDSPDTFDQIRGGLTSVFGDQLGGGLGNVIEGSVTNVQSSLGNIVGNIGNDVANSVVRGIQTGNFSLQPNPVESAKNVVGNVGNNLKTGATRQVSNFVGSQVASGVNSIVNAISDSFNDKNQSGGGG